MGKSVAERLALLPPEERAKALEGVDQEQMLWDWGVWGRPEQIAPLEDTESAIILYLAGRGAGKEAALDTPVPTPDGWTQLGDLHPGDRVLDENGTPCTVLEVHDNEKPRACYLMEFSDGTTILAGADHQWVTVGTKKRVLLADQFGWRDDFSEDWVPQMIERGKPRSREPGTGPGGDPYYPYPITTEHIAQTVHLVSYAAATGVQPAHCIPRAKPLVLPARSLPMDPYLLGVALAGRLDYQLDTVVFLGEHAHGDALHAQGVLKERGIDIALEYTSSRGRVGLRADGLFELLASMEIGPLPSDKKIPMEYLRASRSQRLALLHGLMDTAGQVGDNGRHRVSAKFPWRGGSDLLMRGLEELLRTLSEQPFTCKLNYSAYPAIGWRPSRFSAFRIPRKNELVDYNRLLTVTNKNLRNRATLINNVTPHEVVPMRCITVDSPNSMYLLGTGMIPTHNTRSAMEWVRDRNRRQPGSRVALVARTAADVRDTLLFGEALALDTPIATPDGFVLMGDVQEGDIVLGADGEPTKVSWASETARGRPCYRITFRNGSSFVADAEHKWLTVNSVRYRDGSLRPKVRTTEHLSHLTTRTWVDAADSLKLPAVDLPIPPYTLGVWLGDGHSSHGAVTTPDHEVLGGIINDGFDIRYWPSSDNGLAATFGILGLKRLLTEYGLYRNKHVPGPYLRGSYQQRLSLLQGLMDTDGTISKTGHAAFDNTNLALCEAVHELAATLGIKSTLRHHRPAGVGHADHYQVAFTTDVPVFTVGHKSTRVREDYSPEVRRHFIQDVEPVESVPVRCIAVESKDQLFLIGQSMIPTHNSGLMAITPPSESPTYEPSKRLVTFPKVGDKQTTILLFSSMEPSLLRGPQFHYAVCVDEMSSVRTDRGTIPVREVRAGDRVASSQGMTRVRASRRTGSREVMRVRTEREELIATPDHRVMTQRGWVEVRDLVTSDEMLDTALPHAAVQRVVEISKLPGTRPVWDLTTDSGDFFANGLLVHNCDEIATWSFSPDDSGLTAWDNVQIATRLGEQPQIFAMTTPKRIPPLIEMINRAANDGDVHLIRGTTKDNEANLSRTYMRRIYSLYEGTRLERQELGGELVDDIEGAMWSYAVINDNRVPSVPPAVARNSLMLVAVDPSVAENPRDECGIVVVASSTESELYRRHAYVLEDASLKASPMEWAERVVEVSRRWNNAPVVAETNQGGDLVRTAIQGIDPSIKVVKVSATKGKALRAEPIAVAYDRSVVHHVGTFPQLEDQMMSWEPTRHTASPDRLDALVHGLTALLITPPGGFSGGRLRARSLASRAAQAVPSDSGRGGVRRLTLPTGSRMRLAGRLRGQ